MSDQAPDQQPETDVSDLLEAAARTVTPPSVPASDDVVRGRRRLRRRRASAAVAVLVTVGVVGTGFALVAGDGDRSTAPVATDPTSDPTAPPTTPDPPVDDRDAKQLLTDYARTIADHLDPEHEHLDVGVSNLQGGGYESIGTKLGWSVDGESGLGVVEVFVTAHDGANAYNYFCDRFTPCEDRTVDGVEARVQHDGATVTVWAVRDDGSAAMLHVDPLFGNNSLTPLESLDFPVDQLIRAAADPRLTAPTRQQTECADEAFGWPSFDPDTGKLLKHGKPQCR